VAKPYFESDHFIGGGSDFMAGWAMAKYSFVNPRAVTENAKSAAMTMFGLGDTFFDDRKHHGEPELRHAMVAAGLNSGRLDVEHAWAEAHTMLNLPPLPKLR
jgi:hypothetical protein